jgi:hypothetical protein
LKKNGIMKFLSPTILIVLLSLIAHPCFSQSIEEDKVLQGLKEILPGNWKMEVREGNLVVECVDSVWVLFHNKINQPANAGVPKPAPGSRPNAVSRFIFHLEPRWDEGKKAQVTASNSKVGSDVAALEAKHGVGGLKKVSKGRVIYVPKTEEDKKKIAAFLMAQREVSTDIQPLPDFQTQQYALFQLAATGMDSEYETIFPEETNRQMYAIRQYLDGNAKP